VKTIFLLACATVFFSFSLKKEAPIAVQCADLNEIIRCASLDTIWASDGHLKETLLGRNLYQLNFQALRYKGINEVITSERIKKVYHLEAVHHIPSPSQAIILNNTILKHLKVCLESWEIDSNIKQADGNPKIKDYLFTNSEDETTVRLSTSKKSPKSYTVALEIY
jgi:hypothetical protein